MRVLLLVFFSMVMLIAPVLTQTVIFTEDFESGTPNPAWELYQVGEEPLQAIPMGSAPAPLAGGGNYVGFLQDADGSYSGAGIALAGDTSLQNYTIEADVYCYVWHPISSAYTGLIAYADTSVGIYYKLAADFDANDRFRLYNNIVDTVTYAYSFHYEIPATGLYSTDDWHHMKLEVNTINDSTTQFLCFFDGNVIGVGYYADTTDYQVGKGKFGLFSFQQTTSGLEGYFDNIVVTDNGASAIEDNVQLLPEKLTLGQNYPNPFNPSTTIEFNLDKSEYVKLNVYNTAGEIIKTLTNKEYSSGTHIVHWDATDILRNKVSAGVYLYSLQTDSRFETKKMILLK